MKRIVDITKEKIETVDMRKVEWGLPIVAFDEEGQFFGFVTYGENQLGKTITFMERGGAKFGFTERCLGDFIQRYAGLSFYIIEKPE